MQSAKTSDRTIFFAAANRLPVTFMFSETWTVTGYLAGMDSYHWKAIDTDGIVHLIHKTQAVVRIDESAMPWNLLDGDSRDVVEAVAGPFCELARQQKGH